MTFGTTLRSTVKGVGAVAAASILTLGLAACSSSAPEEDSSTDAATSTDLGTLVVGATAVPAGEIVNFVAGGQAAEAGLTIEYTEFSDYIVPNTSLAEGSLDVNLFQHAPYLENFNAENETDLVSVGEVYLPPLALYSNKVDAYTDLAEGDTIAVPNDPTNEGRSLQLLADHGLIEVNDNPTTIADVTEDNGFTLVELDAASLPGSLDDADVTAAIVNLSFALPAGLTGDQQLLAEGTESPFYNVLATRSELVDDPRVVAFYELLTSDETKAFIEETYQGLVVPAE